MLPPAGSCTLQVTAVLVVPETPVLNCIPLLISTVVDAGFMDTEISGVTVMVAVAVFVLSTTLVAIT